MTTEFRLPSLGEDVKSGDVLSLLVSEGDQVEAEQGVIELETDKATVEVPCPVAGRVTKIHVTEGQTIEVGGLVLTVEESATSGARQESKKPGAAAKSVSAAGAASNGTTGSARSSAETGAGQVEEPATRETARAAAPRSQSAVPSAAAVAAPAEKAAEPATRTPPEEAGSNAAHPAPAGPAVRRLARELGVDLARVPATAPSGRISKEDVKAFVRETTSKAADSTGQGAGRLERDRWGIVRRDPLSKIRQTIAEKMVQSYTTIPQLTNFDDADITELEQIRQASKADYAQQGVKLTTLPFIVKAVASALKLHSVINASLDGETAEIIYKQYVSVGIAVDTPRGLVVPVLRNVDEMNVPQLARGLAQLAEAAREGRYTVEDLRGGTFTISNLGAVGGSYSTPLINPPEVAILLPGRARKLPIFVEERVEARLMLPLSLTYDHRVVDGAAAARFLNEVKGFLEAPGRLLLAL